MILFNVEERETSYCVRPNRLRAACREHIEAAAYQIHSLHDVVAVVAFVVVVDGGEWQTINNKRNDSNFISASLAVCCPIAEDWKIGPRTCFTFQISSNFIFNGFYLENWTLSDC